MNFIDMQETHFLTEHSFFFITFIRWEKCPKNEKTVLSHLNEAKKSEKQ